MDNLIIGFQNVATLVSNLISPYNQIWYNFHHRNYKAQIYCYLYDKGKYCQCEKHGLWTYIWVDQQKEWEDIFRTSSNEIQSVLDLWGLACDQGVNWQW